MTQLAIPSTADLLAREADFTALPVVRQFFDSLRVKPTRYVDGFSGPGGFGLVCGEMFPGCERLGVDKFDDDWESMCRNYSAAYVGDSLELIRKHEPPYDMMSDLIGGNPAFSCAADFCRLVLEERCLTVDGLLFILQTDDFGQRSADKVRLFEDHTPILQMRIPGTLKFRTGINPKNGKPWTTDTRSYSWWVWSARPNRKKSWRCINLPPLPKADREWSIRPGEEWRHPPLLEGVVGG